MMIASAALFPWRRSQQQPHRQDRCRCRALHHPDDLCVNIHLLAKRPPRGKPNKIMLPASNTKSQLKGVWAMIRVRTMQALLVGAGLIALCSGLPQEATAGTPRPAGES